MWIDEMKMKKKEKKNSLMRSVDLLLVIGLLLLLSSGLQFLFNNTQQQTTVCDCHSTEQTNDALQRLVDLSQAHDLPYEFDRDVVGVPGRITELQAKLLLVCHGRVRELEAERKMLLNRIKKLEAASNGV